MLATQLYFVPPRSYNGDKISIYEGVMRHRKPGTHNILFESEDSSIGQGAFIEKVERKRNEELDRGE